MTEDFKSWSIERLVWETELLMDRINEEDNPKRAADICSSYHKYKKLSDKQKWVLIYLLNDYWTPHITPKEGIEF